MPFSHSTQTVIRTSESVLSTNRVLKNTYILLSLTLLFSAFTAYIAMVTHARTPNILLMIVGTYGLMFLTQALRNSVWGLVSVFAFTGFLGYTVGPLLNYILDAYNNGSQIVMMAMGATGVVFLSLSAYVVMTKKDFSYLAGFLFVAAMIGLLTMIASFIFPVPALSLMVSAIFALLASGMILFQTSIIINGGERNYIMATIALFVAIYNLFISLLQLFTAFGGNRD